MIMKSKYIVPLMLLFLLSACGPSDKLSKLSNDLIEKCKVGSHASVSLSLGLFSTFTTKCEWVVTKKSKEDWQKD